MLTEPDVWSWSSRSREMFRQSTSEGLSGTSVTSTPKEKDSSEEEEEVFIGPATSRIFENPPDEMVNTKKRGGRPLLRSTVCRYYLSQTGCKREDCAWKHEFSGEQDSEINPPSMGRGKFNKEFNSIYFDEKMRRLHLQNKELTRKNQELESENLELKRLTRDIHFLEEENQSLRKLIRENAWDQTSRRRTHCRPRIPPRYHPSEDYIYPISRSTASRAPLAPPHIDYRSRFLDTRERDPYLT